MEIQQIIEQLNMQPHPEGGYFVETYKSVVNAENSTNSIATVIYFLLPSGEKSTWHRIKNDEFWFYHSGSPIVVHTIENGAYAETIVGNAVLSQQYPQFLVKGGVIFGASVLDENSYSLVSCVVVPGFEFKDFELFSQTELVAQFPTLADKIALLY